MSAKKTSSRKDGTITKKGKRFYAVLTLPKQSAQRCISCNKRYWIESRPRHQCDCGGELKSTVERRHLWSEGFTTNAEANQKLTEMLGKVREKTYVLPTNETVGEFFDRWIETQIKLRPTTLHSYGRKFELYVRPRLGLIPLQEVELGQLKNIYIEVLKKGGVGGKPVSARTLQHVHRLLFHVFGDAQAEGLVTRNPCAEKSLRELATVEDDPDTEIWTRAQLRAFVEFAQDDPDYLLWRIYAYTGCRRGEGIGMWWEDIDFNSGEWSIKRSLVEVNGTITLQKPKTRKGIRVVGLDPETLSLLEAHRSQQVRELGRVGGGYVFSRDGKPYHPTVISRHFQNLVKWAGLPRIRLHDVRHSVISALVSGGTPIKSVSSMVGHSSTSFTMDRYSKHLPSDRKAVARDVANIYVEGQQQ